MTGALARILRGLGPALPLPGIPETLRAALGAGLGLGLANLVLQWASPGAISPILIIAPFGASAFLIYVVPSSPLAQPWPVVVGNAVSAAAALVVLMLPLPGLAQMALAVVLAVAAMALVRAQHPPGGAVALTTVLTALSGRGLSGRGLDWSWVWAPVAAGSLTLVGFGIFWALLTGRSYPFRQPAAPNAPAAAPAHRLSPSPEALAESLTQLRLAANIGVEDLARVIDRAEALSPGLDPSALRAGAVMTPGVISARPEATPAELIALFQRHGFKSLPVVRADGAFVGLIPQAALLDAGPARTAETLAKPVQTLTPDAPLSDLIRVLAEDAQAAVPILDQGRLVGIVTRSDLIAALLHQLGLR